MQPFKELLAIKGQAAGWDLCTLEGFVKRHVTLWWSWGWRLEALAGL